MDTLDRILSLLENKGLKQKDLTDYLGIGKGAFTTWKSGKTNSYLRYIPQIAVFLDTSPNYLLGNTDAEKPIDEQLGDTEFALLDGMKGLSDDGKKAVLRYVNFLKQEELEGKEK